MIMYVKLIQCPLEGDRVIILGEPVGSIPEQFILTVRKVILYKKLTTKLTTFQSLAESGHLNMKLGVHCLETTAG